MFLYQNLIVDTLKADLHDIDDFTALTVGLSAQVGIPDAQSTDPYVVGFSYSASSDKSKEPFLTLEIRIFFSSPEQVPADEVSDLLLQGALKYLKTHLETLSQALCINTLPCPDKF
ncbi:MAG: hypothetical protein LIR47_02355 [Spirochaetota bacterium]|jgi:hypothetical protein|nr:hypothetical protein [Spirochaetota bacterium]